MRGGAPESAACLPILRVLPWRLCCLLLLPAAHRSSSCLLPINRLLLQLLFLLPLLRPVG